MIRTNVVLLPMAAAALAGVPAGCAHGPTVAEDIASPRGRLDRYVGDLTTEYPALWYGAVSAEGRVHAVGGGYADVASAGAMTEDTAMYVYSLAKIVTSLAVVQLAEAGDIDLDKQVQFYLPWVPYPGTVRQYLSHSAGVPNPIWGSFYIHWPEQHAELNRDAFLREVCAENGKAKFGPGEDVSYSNLGYAILGALIEEQSGQSYEAYVRQHIFDPLGMEDAAMDPTHPAKLAKSYISRSLVTRIAMRMFMDNVTFEREGAFVAIPPLYYFDFPAHGGLVLSPADMERFLRAILCRNAELLGAVAWEWWFTPTAVAGEEYALGWRIEESDKGRVFTHAGGAMGQSAMIRLYPGSGVATFFQSNILDSMRVKRTDMDVLDGLLFESL
jgi:CubicO group peptidase (beta-lactamase class C family)